MINAIYELDNITRSSLIRVVRESLSVKHPGFSERYFAKFGIEFEQEFNRLLTGTTNNEWRDELAARYALIELRDKVLAIN